jgi:hypothetical protein
MKGCGLLMDPASAKILKQRSSWLASLAERLGGRFDLRSSATATAPDQDIVGVPQVSSGLIPGQAAPLVSDQLN